jgi:sugar phosphate permease
MFIVIGLIGLGVAVLYWIFLKDPKRVQATDPIQISPDNQALKPSISFIQILKEPLIWRLFIAYFAAYTIQWGIASWIPTYLVTVRHLNLSTLGLISIIPAMAALLGMFLTGFISDKLPQGRDRLLAVFAMACVAVLLLLMYEAPNLTAYVIYASLQMFCISVVGLMLPTIPLKYMPAEVVGKTSGFMNTGGQLAGFITPLVIGVIVDAFGGSFFAAFLYMIAFAIICVIATLTMRLKVVEKKIEEPGINSAYTEPVQQ